MKKYKLGDIANIIGGVAFQPCDVCKNGIRVLRGGNIQAQSIVTKENDLFLPSSYKNKENQLQIGDTVIVASTGSVEVLGKAATCFKELPNTQIGAFLRIVRPKEKCYAMLISIALNSSHFAKYIKSQAKGTSINNITLTHLTNYTFFFPASSQLIGNLYQSIEEKIALNRSINHNLEAMAKQLYDYWFVQFDFPDENGMPYKSSGGKMVWNEKLKREIPEGWDDVILNDFLIIKNGRDHKLLATGNYPVYGSGGEMRRVSAYLYNGEAILMPRKGSLNNIMYVNKAFWTVDTMFYSEMKIPNCAKYVFFAIKDIDFTRWDSGTGVPSMTASLLYSIPLVKPNDLILQTFDNVLLPIFQKLEKVQLENENLTKLRDSLLPLLMNGQVSVNYDLSNDRFLSSRKFLLYMM